MLSDSSEGRRTYHDEDDDFEYNMNDSEDEIYSVSSDDEGYRNKGSREAPLLREEEEEPENNLYLPPVPQKQKIIIEDNDDDIRSLTSSTASNNNATSPFNNRISTIDYLKQKQDQLMKKNQQLNVEAKHVFQETDNIVKQQAKKVEAMDKRPNSARSTVSNVSTPVSSKGNRSITPSTTTRPSSAASAKRKVQEKIDELAEFEDDDLDRAANEMGLEAAMKFYKARVKAMEKELNQSRDIIKQKDDKIKELDIKYNATLSESKRTSKQQSQYQSRIDRQRKEFDALQLKFKKQTSTVNEMQKEIERLKQNTKLESNINQNNNTEENKTDPNTRVKELKYVRALEEIEKYKNQINDLQKNQREETDKVRKDIDSLRKENKRLDRQKQDLVLAFKKQMKLIDILKRQIIHLEAAKLLSFTEEEFTSIINQ
ncbi:hypothetical protein ABK040_002418 [Willaertia magna]